MIAIKVLFVFLMIQPLKAVTIAEVNFKLQKIIIKDFQKSYSSDLAIISSDQNVKLADTEVFLNVYQVNGYLFLKNQSGWIFFLCWGSIDPSILTAAVEMELWQGQCIPSTQQLVYEKLIFLGLPENQSVHRSQYFKWLLPPETQTSSGILITDQPQELDCQEFKQLWQRNSAPLYTISHGRWQSLTNISQRHHFYLIQNYRKVYFTLCR